jgi:hypothetical protein
VAEKLALARDASRRAGTPEPAAREAVVHELCGRIRIDPSPYLRPARNPPLKAQAIAD